MNCDGTLEVTEALLSNSFGKRVSYVCMYDGAEYSNRKARKKDMRCLALLAV